MRRLFARADDRREVFEDLSPVTLSERRGGHAAVAVDDRRQALPQLKLAETGTEHCEVAVAVDIQKAGRHGFAACVDPAAVCGR